MLIFITTLLASLASIFRSRASLGLENLALRHQIGEHFRLALIPLWAVEGGIVGIEI